MENFDFNRYKNISFSSLIDELLLLSGTELSILACLLGYALTVNTSIRDQNSLGNFFELLGQFILTSSAQNYKLESDKSPQTQDMQQQINELYKQFQHLKKN